MQTSLAASLLPSLTILSSSPIPSPLSPLRCSFANVGLTAVLELFFAQFLFVCYNNATSLASSGVNVFLAIVQVCGLSGGFLADKVIGEWVLPGDD